MIAKEYGKESTNSQLQTPTSEKHIKLRVNDREIVCPVEVANAFNTYFSSLGNN